ncbi:MAG TPA: ABC transporter ATP-binding protein [Nitrospirae bacterium]|nr:ABC transporter ATP-binding protein [Nitrospirota bacterium]
MNDNLIQTEGLKKSFFTPAGELAVIKSINSIFKKGEIVSIVGLSGAGKSTFLHILGTLDSPTGGKVNYFLDEGQYIDPFVLNPLDLSVFRNNYIGFIFQFHYLLPEFSALENVMMPGLIHLEHKKGKRFTKEYLTERAKELLSDLGIYNRRQHKAGELSGGEQQRVATARALLLDPMVVFADEPTGNLDSATGEELFKLLLKINETKGTTFVIVTHNEYLSRRCHRVLEMKDGVLESFSV